MNCPKSRHAFSLVELVIVIVIIGVIAAIAVPRISRGAKGASDAAMIADLATMRSALDLYSAEHAGLYPGATTFADQMTTFSNEAGATVATLDSTHIFGPYLKAVPGLPIAGTGTTGGKKGDTGVAAADALTIGWLYTAATGVIVANTGTSKDDANKAYNTY